MKKMLKLNELNKREMTIIRGGNIECGSSGTAFCGCGCQYANEGGSSQSDNMGANKSGGYYSKSSIIATNSLPLGW